MMQDLMVNGSHFTNNPYEAEGFVYLIIEKSTGKRYIGKKSYWNYSKGKRVRQSNWKTYASVVQR